MSPRCLYVCMCCVRVATFNYERLRCSKAHRTLTNACISCIQSIVVCRHFILLVTSFTLDRHCSPNIVIACHSPAFGHSNYTELKKHSFSRWRASRYVPHNCQNLCVATEAPLKAAVAGRCCRVVSPLYFLLFLPLPGPERTLESRWRCRCHPLNVFLIRS